MKTSLSRQSSSATLRAASAKFILTGLVAAAASFALPASGRAQISTNPFTLDGVFSGGTVPRGTPGFPPTGQVFGEWSDVVPFAFISDINGTNPTFFGDTNTNALLYAALSKHTQNLADPVQLHLLYDFLPRTQLPLPGQILASVTFPVTLQGRAKDNISVVFQGNGLASFFDIFVDLDVIDTNSPLFPINSGIFPGLEAKAAFAGSTLSASPHLIVELEVPLRIPAGFFPPGGSLPGGGINPTTGMYDPDPVFWGAAAGGDGNPAGAGGGGGGDLQAATAALIGINPNGSLTVTPVPEPSTAALLVGGLGLLGARRRRAV